MKPLCRTDTRWSSELAYAVGLIATDGSLSIDGRHIVLVSKDKQLLNTFKKCLDLKNKIGVKKGGFIKEKIYYYVQFGDINFYKWLLGLGLTPNKTKTIYKLFIPDKYFMDFLRGHFDGDGYFYSYWDKRWPNSFMFYTNFISCNLRHLHWLRDRINKLLNIQGHITKSSESTWALRFAKKDSKILLSKMYSKRNIPCLERKKKKIKKCFSIP